jgi:hypothetical protein
VTEGSAVSTRTDGALASNARSASVSRWADAVATTAVDLSIDEDLLLMSSSGCARAGDDRPARCAPSR